MEKNNQFKKEFNTLKAEHLNADFDPIMSCIGCLDDKEKYVWQGVDFWKEKIEKAGVLKDLPFFNQKNSSQLCCGVVH